MDTALPTIQFASEIVINDQQEVIFSDDRIYNKNNNFNNNNNFLLNDVRVYAMYIYSIFFPKICLYSCATHFKLEKDFTCTYIIKIRRG